MHSFQLKNKFGILSCATESFSGFIPNEFFNCSAIEEDRFPESELETKIIPFVGIEKPLSAGLLNPGITKT